MYFTETALALNREGFHAETKPSGTLGVWLDDKPLCEVSEVGGITCRGENISTLERGMPRYIFFSATVCWEPCLCR